MFAAAFCLLPLYQEYTKKIKRPIVALLPNVRTRNKPEWRHLWTNLTHYFFFLEFVLLGYSIPLSRTRNKKTLFCVPLALLLYCKSIAALQPNSMYLVPKRVGALRKGLGPTVVGFLLQFNGPTINSLTINGLKINGLVRMSSVQCVFRTNTPQLNFLRLCVPW